MRKIDHIGIIVADLESAVARLGVLFGPAEIKNLPDVGLRVAEFRAANVTVELLQYTQSSELARRVMGSRIGLNHLSIHVDDAERSVAELRQAGFVPQEGFPRQGAHGQVAFFEPDAVTGLLFEICEPQS